MPKTFLTEAGLEARAVTGDEMREIERIAIEETGPNLYQMLDEPLRESRPRRARGFPGRDQPGHAPDVPRRG